MTSPQSPDSTATGTSPEEQVSTTVKSWGGHRQAWRLGVLAVLALAAIVVLIVLRYGGSWLVKTDPLPAHAEVAVMLDGPAKGVIARRAGAVNLLEGGVVDHVMLSMQSVTVWGENMPELARDYLLSNYGPQIADRVVFCFQDTDSTAAEALGLRQCLEQRNWRSVIVVTSQYHTRRAGMIWRHEFANANPPFKIWVHGVYDPDYRALGWWRSRRYAKTWLLEGTKTIWTYCFGAGS
ncbi:MAG: YdcF family protein [Terriglobia bacterium]